MLPLDPSNPAEAGQGIPPVVLRPTEGKDAATVGLFGATASMVGFKLVSAAALVVVGVVTARQLQPEGRGVFVLLVAIASLGLLLSSLGVNVAARVHLVAPVDPIASGDYFGLAGSLVLAQCLVCVGLGSTLLPLVDVRLSPALLVLFAGLGGALLAQYLLNDALNAYGHTTVATSLEAAGTALQMLLVIVLASTGERRIAAFVAVLVITNAAQAVVALAILRSRGVSLRPRYSGASWRRLLRTGLPGIPTALGQLLTFRIDRYLVGLFLNPAAVGVYSVAATAPEMLRLPSIALGQPILYRLASGSARPEDFRRIRAICLALTGAMVAIVFVIAPFAVRIAFGVEYLDAVTPLRVLLLGELGIAVFHLDGALLVGTNRVKHLAVAAMVGLAVVSMLDLVLIPRFGLAGAAWASVIAYSSMGAVAGFLVWRTRTPGSST